MKEKNQNYLLNSFLWETPQQYSYLIITRLCVGTLKLQCSAFLKLKHSFKLEVL